MDKQLYEIAARWEDDITTSEEREALKAVVARLVGYPVRIACDPVFEEGYVDIMIQNATRSGRGGGVIQDLLELQSSGAVGLATEGAGARLQAIRAACEAYNAEHGLVFEELELESDSESEMESDADTASDDA
jgi:hypothetical protein